MMHLLRRATVFLVALASAHVTKPSAGHWAEASGQSGRGLRLSTGGTTRLSLRTRRQPADDGELAGAGAGAEDGFSVESMVLSEGLIGVYTDPADEGALVLDLAKILKGNIKVLVSATWAQGTFASAGGQRTILHEPVDGTTETMLTFGRSRDGSMVDVHQPRVDLRTSDVQLKNALEKGAWAGWAGSVKKLPRSDDKFLVDGSEFIMRGFYIEGWSFADSLGSFRIRNVKAYPKNVLVTVEMQLIDQSGVYVPVVMTFSMLKLPERAMTPRRGDDRLGFFQVEFIDVGQHMNEHRTSLGSDVDVERSWIQRFNLSASPTKQITFYVDPTVPSRWRPYFKEGVEAWNVAFSAIGHDHAIKAVLPGTAEWPADYDPDDARYSTISWSIDVTDVYALGLAKVDPRSGQIMKSDIVVTSGWVHSWLNEFDIEAPKVTHRATSYRREEARGNNRQPPKGHNSQGAHVKDGDRSIFFEHRPVVDSLLRSHEQPADMRIEHETKTPFQVPPLTFAAAGHDLTADAWEAVIGSGLRSVVMHETGHSLGLRHNFKASTGVDEKCLRNAACIREQGLTKSIMDYVPANIFGLQSNSTDAPDIFPSRLGAYDILAIKYGYGDSNVTRLNRVLSEAESVPFCTDEDRIEGTDPFCALHDLGANPLVYYKERLRLFEKEQQKLLEMTVEPGASYTSYGQNVLLLLRQAQSIGQNLASFVGGISTTHMHRGFDGTHPERKAAVVVPAWQQREALRLAVTIAKPKTIARFLPAKSRRFLIVRTGDLGTLMVNIQEEVRRMQLAVIQALMSKDLLARLMASEGLEPAGYSLADYLGELFGMIFGDDGAELSGNDEFRDLQSMFVASLKAAYNERCDEYVPAALLSELLTNLQNAKKAVKRQYLVRVEHGGSDGADGSSFLNYLEAELSDFNRPCKKQH